MALAAGSNLGLKLEKVRSSDTRYTSFASSLQSAPPPGEPPPEPPELMPPPVPALPPPEPPGFVPPPLPPLPLPPPEPFPVTQAPARHTFPVVQARQVEPLSPQANSEVGLTQLPASLQHPAQLLGLHLAFPPAVPQDETPNPINSPKESAKAFFMILKG